MRRLTSTAVRFCHAQLLETTAKRNISVCSKLAGSMELPTVIKKYHTFLNLHFMHFSVNLSCTFCHINNNIKIFYLCLLKFIYLKKKHIDLFCFWYFFIPLNYNKCVKPAYLCHIIKAARPGLAVAGWLLGQCWSPGGAEFSAHGGDHHAHKRPHAWGAAGGCSDTR